MIPTAVTERETQELQRLARGKRVLEVGSLLGYSTVRLAEVAEVVVAVDPHEGYPAHDPRPTLAPFLENLEWSGVRERVRPMIGRDSEILPFLAPGSFDLAFLDTTGIFEDTLRTITLCVPLLRHYGVLAVHDCGHPDWPGALAAVEVFSGGVGTDFRLVDRLGIFEQTWGGIPT